jgi:outer membrane protein assembly factor BamB
VKKLVSLLALAVFIILTGCSNKTVYEPQSLSNDWKNYGDKEFKIVGLGAQSALLEDKNVLTKDGVLDIKVDEENRLVSKSDGWIITTKIDGTLTLLNIENKEKKIVFNLKKTIASASIKDNILAVLFADSEMALYDLSTKEVLLKEQGGKSLTVDARIAPPFFLNDLVLFPTLDGKVVIVNASLKKKLRTIIVSTEDNFNNVIYLNVIDNKIIAATGTKILAISQKEIRVNYEIRSIIYDGKNIYIATKQGEIISLTPELQVNAKEKFPFAHFVSMISYKDKLYVLEKEGYIIVMDKKLIDYKVHKVDVEDGYIFIDNKTFYIADEYISVE